VRTYDLAIVGAGIVGLAHALMALRRGLSVVVIEREAQAIGASIRNFGFITVTGQRRGATWARARRSAEVWRELSRDAGIAVVQRGLMLVVRRPEGAPILEAFLATEMGEGCALLSAAEARGRMPALAEAPIAAALTSSHDMRVESREAIPLFTRYLEAQGVAFLGSTTVRDVVLPTIVTARGEVRANAAVICPGDDLSSLYPERIAAYGVTRCKLQMLRAEAPAFRLESPVMTDLSLVRYRGYADLAESAPLRERLAREQRDHLANGVHLIVAQSADGSLVLGDSHHCAASPEPFASEAVDRLILEEYEALFGPAPPVRERWVGTYSSAAEDMFRDAPEDRVRLVMVTSGTGASTAFGIAEETIDDLYGAKA
jgi:FAD dependent oxidoreductase TIGR03364